MAKRCDQGLLAWHRQRHLRLLQEVTVGKEGKIRADISVSEDDNVIVRAIEGDKNAIGFFGYAYFAENQGKLTAVPIVNQRLVLPLRPRQQPLKMPVTPRSADRCSSM